MLYMMGVEHAEFDDLPEKEQNQGREIKGDRILAMALLIASKPDGKPLFDYGPGVRP